mgnify:CR=1 FL=1|tara:strand:- start:14501 stop:15007 length:507 start_codon:yes stop_codon:yes gene_type:complete
MPKRLRREPIYIAPQIIGKINEDGNPWVFDEITMEELNPNKPLDKIKIYERQVKGWFLEPAFKMARYRSENKGFIVLMICLSYIEGVEEYKTGQSSRNRSGEFFRNGLHRIFSGLFTDDQLNRLYREARCGIFHNGMVRGQIIINNQFENSLSFPDAETIKISPSKFL